MMRYWAATITCIIAPISSAAAKNDSIGEKSVLEFTVLAAAVTGIVTLLTIVIKDYLAVRSFEKWKAKQSLIAVYGRYKRPIALAARELSERCRRRAVPSCEEDEIGMKALYEKYAPEMSAAVDDHYRKYRFVSDIYRLCCFLGWVELYLRDLGLMDTGEKRQNRELEECLKLIQADLSDGRIIPFPDWENWTDWLIFGEEQRAIGHRMIESGAPPSLIDFGSFHERIESDQQGNGAATWFLIAARFFAELQEENDFRRVRMKRLVVHLTTLRNLLEPDSVPEIERKAAQQLEFELRKEKCL